MFSSIPAAFARMCPPTPAAPVPRFPSFLAQAGETAAVCEAPECCWQGFPSRINPSQENPASLCRWPCQPEPAGPGCQTHPLRPFLRLAVTQELSPGLLALLLADAASPFHARTPQFPPPQLPFLGGIYPVRGSEERITFGARTEDLGFGWWCCPIWPGVPGGAELQAWLQRGRCPRGRDGLRASPGAVPAAPRAARRCGGCCVLSMAELIYRQTNTHCYSERRFPSDSFPFF